MKVIHELGMRIANSRLVDRGARERALAVIQQSYPWTAIDEFAQGTKMYLAAHPNVVIALTELIDGPTLASLANDVAEDKHFCPANAPPLQAANRLLESLGAPTIAWNPYYRGVHRIRARVNQEEQKFSRLRHSRQVPTGADLAHFGIVIWKDVDVLLKVCTRFYYRALRQQDASAVGKALRCLNRCTTLGWTLKVIWDLEQVMKREEQAKRQCYYLLGRSSPFQGLLDRPHDLDLSTKEVEWQTKYNRYLHERRRQMGQHFEGPYWADVFRADVQIYRNFYAHENDDVALAAGVDKAARSFDAASRMLDHMLSGQVAEGQLVPQLALPIERGTDYLGRETVKLVPDSDLKDDGTYDSPVTVYRLAEWDRNLPELHLFRFYLCCPVYDLALNPVLIPLEDIRPATLRKDE